MDEMRRIRLDPEPVRLPTSTLRVYRGGEWFWYDTDSGSARRDFVPPSSAEDSSGCRLTLTTEDATDANDTPGP